MELSAADITLMQKELQKLREQNFKLKLLLQEARQNAQQEDYNMLTKSTAFIPKKRFGDKQIQKCPHCLKLQQTPVEKSRKQLVEQFQQWSHRLNNKFAMKKHLPQLQQVQQEQSFDGHMDIPSPKRFPLIQHICFYGPNQEEMLNAEKSSKISHRLYIPQKDDSLQLYGNYLYPQKVGFKMIREKKKEIQINNILFRKSFKQQDCSIFIFQSRSEILEKHNQNPILREINPFMSLYSIGLQFVDFFYSDKPNSKNPPSDDKSSSFSVYSQQKFEEISHGQAQIPNSQQFKKIKSSYGQTSIYKSSYFLCIMTYFPFVDFFSQLLIKIIDQIKIRRMQNQDINNKYEALDIKYVIKQLTIIIKQIQKCFINFQMVENTQLELTFGSQNIFLRLQRQIIRENIICGWSYKILRLMDKDILYDIYCLVMMEQSICVLCQNTFVLTFAIHLLVSLLPKPFIYPHPIVSTVFEEELLETPFTAIMGINKNTKWFEDNDDYLYQKLQGKIIFNLSDEQVKIKCKNKQKLPKSQKIKKLIANFYKKAQKIDKNSKKRDFLTRQVSDQQNQLVFQLFNDFQQFYKQQLLNFMPNKEIIDTIRTNIKGDNLTATNAQLIRNVEQYICQSRKNRQQDAFVNILMKKQIFGVYISQRYDLV